LPIPHRNSYGYDGGLNNVEAGKRNIHNLRVVIMVPAWVVAFRPEILAETLAPSSDFAVSIGFCSYFVC
jgi:hypothetical protein